MIHQNGVGVKREWHMTYKFQFLGEKVGNQPLGGAVGGRGVDECL